MKTKINKLKLIGAGNEGRRNFFVLKKEDSFFSSFPLFLIGCGFKQIGTYEEYQENKPDLSLLNNSLEHFQNEDYDIDVIYTSNRIILLIRTDQKNREKLRVGIRRITETKTEKREDQRSKKKCMGERK